MRQIMLFGCVCALVLAGCESQGKSAAPAAKPAAKPAPVAPAKTGRPTATAPAAKPDKPTASAPAATAPAAPTTAPATQPAPTFDEGPLRVEIEAMREIRYLYPGADERSAPLSYFDMLLRIRGERITDIFRRGNPILTEVVDETGQSMLDPNSIPEKDKTATQAINVPPEARREKGIEMQTARGRPSNRAARHFKKVSGTVRVLLGQDAQKITIFNPLQSVGAAIDDPRLNDLGLEIRLVPPEELEQPPPPQCVVVQIKKKTDNIQSVSFFDGRLQPLPAPQERPMTTKLGEACTAYCLQAQGALDNETQLVLDVFQKVEDIQLPIEAHDIDLP